MTNNEWLQLIVAAENMQMSLAGLVEVLRTASHDSEIEEEAFQLATQKVNDLSWVVSDSCEEVARLLG